MSQGPANNILSYVAPAVRGTKPAANSAALQATEEPFQTTQKNKLANISVTSPIDLDTINEAITNLGTAVIFKGTWDPTTGVFPGGGAAQTGWMYLCSDSGTVDGHPFVVDDRIIAIVDNASETVYAGNWVHAAGSGSGGGVLAVAGKTGLVTLVAADISDAGAKGQEILQATNTAGAQAALSLVPGTDVQEQDDLLQSIADVASPGYIRAISTTEVVPVRALEAGLHEKTEAFLFATRANPMPQALIAALNELVQDTADILALLDGLYLAPLHSEEVSFFNLAAPGTLSLTKTGTVSWAPGGRWQSNGSNGYFGTGVNADTLTKFLQNDAFMFAYTCDDVAADNFIDIGQRTGATNTSFINAREAGGTLQVRANTTVQDTIAVSDSIGFSWWARNNSSDFVMGRNEGAGTTKTRASMAIAASEIAMFRRSTIYSTRGVLAAGFGGFLNQTQRDRLFRALRRFFAATWSIYPSVTRGALEFDNSAEARRAIKVRDRSDITNLSKLVRDDVIVPLHGEPWAYDPDNGDTPNGIDIIAAPSIGNLIRRRGRPLNPYEVDRTIDPTGASDVSTAYQEWLTYVLDKQIVGEVPPGDWLLNNRLEYHQATQIRRFAIRGQGFQTARFIAAESNTAGCISIELATSGSETSFGHFSDLWFMARGEGNGTALRYTIPTGVPSAHQNRSVIAERIRVYSGRNIQKWFNTGLDFARLSRPLILGARVFGVHGSMPTKAPVGVTFTTGTPGVVNFSGSPFLPYSEVTFNTTGTPPTGLTNGGVYYVVNPTATTCNLATSPTNGALGTLIALSTTGSGTHTLTENDYSASGMLHKMGKAINLDGCYNFDLRYGHVGGSTIGISAIGNVEEGGHLHQFNIVGPRVGLLWHRNSPQPTLRLVSNHCGYTDIGYYLGGIRRFHMVGCDFGNQSPVISSADPAIDVLIKGADSGTVSHITYGGTGRIDRVNFVFDASDKDWHDLGATYGFTPLQSSTRDIRVQMNAGATAGQVIRLVPHTLGASMQRIHLTADALQFATLLNANPFQDPNGNLTVAADTKDIVEYRAGVASFTLDVKTQAQTIIQLGDIPSGGRTITLPTAASATIANPRAWNGYTLTVTRRDVGSGALNLTPSGGSPVAVINAGETKAVVYRASNDTWYRIL